MGLYLPARFLSPSLLTPGKKPTGPWRFDGSSTLSRGLVCLHTCDSSGKDLTGLGNNITWVNGPSFGSDENGSYVQLNGSNQYGKIPNTLLGSGTPTGFSCVIVYKSTDSDGMLFSRWTSSTELQLYKQTVSAAWISFGGSKTTFSNESSKIGVITASADDSSDRRSVCTREADFSLQETEGTSSLVLPTSAEDPTGTYLIGTDADGAGNGSLGNWYAGRIYFIAVWNHALDPVELRSLAADPYQLLAPVNDSLWLPEVAGGGIPTLSSPIYSSVQANQATISTTVTF